MRAVSKLIILVIELVGSANRGLVKGLSWGRIHLLPGVRGWRRAVSELGIPVIELMRSANHGSVLGLSWGRIHLLPIWRGLELVLVPVVRLPILRVVAI